MEKNQILGLAVFFEGILTILFYTRLFPIGLWWWLPLMSMFVAIVEFFDILALIGWTRVRIFRGMEREHLE
ncbi:MAG: hypothetical protein QXI39_04010 [Candidatus Bathyarchaeia archaeon]